MGIEANQELTTNDNIMNFFIYHTSINGKTDRTSTYMISRRWPEFIDPAPFPKHSNVRCNHPVVNGGSDQFGANLGIQIPHSKSFTAMRSRAKELRMEFPKHLIGIIQFSASWNGAVFFQLQQRLVMYWFCGSVSTPSAKLPFDGNKHPSASQLPSGKLT